MRFCAQNPATWTVRPSGRLVCYNPHVHTCRRANTRTQASVYASVGIYAWGLTHIQPSVVRSAYVGRTDHICERTKRSEHPVFNSYNDISANSSFVGLAECTRRAHGCRSGSSRWCVARKKAMNVHHDTGVHTHAVCTLQAVVFNILIPLSAPVLLPMNTRFFFSPQTLMTLNNELLPYEYYYYTALFFSLSFFILKMNKTVRDWHVFEMGVNWYWILMECLKE